METWQRYDYVSTGSLRRGKTDRCCLSFRPFQAPRTQPTQQRHFWRQLRGDLTPAEASELGKLIEAYIKALEATDFAERLDKLERMTNR